MENTQAPQNGIVTAPQQSAEITQTFTKDLFATPLRCFSYGLNDEMQEELIKLVNEKTDETDLMSLDAPVIEKFKQIVYDICQELDEFKTVEGRESNFLPQILGSNVLFQQVKEHIPLHAYDFTPLVFTFVINTGQYPQFTYFADTRGAVQTTRQKVFQNLVGTSYGLRGQLGECIVTPGYVQRYTETNLSDQAQVFLNIMVGFTNY